ncbi:hypothetical protein N7448_005757 [Penicillium atrosanguineum]|nr:hypothetical protein N7448_005757 [Penicillium atrosanguineum]
MPDAPMLDDGKTVRFNAWATIVKRKLAANADHYPTAEHRMIYVASRCEGKALLHIHPRLEEDASNPYRDASDIMEHLKGVFQNPNRATEAYQEYQRLAMKPKDDFNDFLAEFVRLAEEANQSEDRRKRDLYDKLPNLLQTQMMLLMDKTTVDFDEFVCTCQSAAHNITLQFKARESRKLTTPSSTGATTGTPTGVARSRASQSPFVKREGASTTPYKPMSVEDRNALMKEGRCFNCREQGHMTRECPKKNTVSTVTTTELQALEQQPTTPDDIQSGKV